MNQTLSIGQKVSSSHSNAFCTVLEFLGHGGQGEVFKARLHDRVVALKWYFPHQATQQQLKALQHLVERGSPDDLRFLWPQEVLVDPAVRGYGYVMPLREDRFQGFDRFLHGKIKPRPTYRSLVTAAYQIVDGYYQLHSRGLCYSDISPGNVFLDPTQGDVMICDNDNVVVDGSPPKTVLGTPRFMAPEIVRMEAMPSRTTDLHSVAVMLFYLFIVHHPLEGRRAEAIKCLDVQGMNKIYGFDPRFIFDPNDKSNEPHPAHHGNAITWWPVYPRAIQRLFTRAFTEGLKDPEHRRVQENEWRRALVVLRDSIYRCEHCKNEIYYDPEFVQDHGHPKPCADCGKQPAMPPRVRFSEKRDVVVLAAGTKLYPHHISPRCDYDFSSVVADVSSNPSDPQKIGLRNLSATKWQATSADGTSSEIPPGRSFHIAGGNRVNFGGVVGEFELS